MGFFSFFASQKKRLLQYSDCLRKGWFVLADNLRTYVRRGATVSDCKFPKGGGGLKNLCRRIVGKLFFSVYVPKDGSKYTADAVYFSTVPNPDYKDAKFFDCSVGQKSVLTFCPNEKRYQLYMQNRERVREYFPLPKLTYRDDEGLSYAEEFVRGLDWRRELNTTKLVYRSLFEFYRNYYLSSQNSLCKRDENRFSCIPKEFRVEEFVENRLHHGDLSADNFRFDDRLNELRFFDFDHANDFPLFYDVFFLMFNEAIVNNQWGGGWTCYVTGITTSIFSWSKFKIPPPRKYSI